MRDIPIKDLSKSKLKSRLLFTGITFVELLITMVIVSIVLVTVFVSFSPVSTRQKARDNRRLADMETLDRLIIEYKLDTGSFPDSLRVLRTSTTLPSDGVSFTDARHGWISGDFRQYTSKLPIDPLNDSTYYYSYYHTETSYELNVRLEYFTDKMSSDGGNDPNVYEVGNNLTLISP